MVSALKEKLNFMVFVIFECQLIIELLEVENIRLLLHFEWTPSYHITNCLSFIMLILSH